MTSLKSLLDELSNDLFQSDHRLAFIYDDGKSSLSSWSSTSYMELKNILESMKTGFLHLRQEFESLLLSSSSSSLSTSTSIKPICAFAFTQWNLSFYHFLLSSIKSEYAFFIIDSQWPPSYTKSLLESVRPHLIIFDLDFPFQTLAETLTGLDYKSAKPNPFQECSVYVQTRPRTDLSHDLAYIISTSGTTGRPKIIQVSNASIIPNFIDLSERFALDGKDVVFQAAPLTFDPSLVELFCAIYSRSTLLITPQVLKLMPKRLAALLLKHNVTTLQLTPTLFKSLSPHIVDNLPSLRRLILGGEMFPFKNYVVKSYLESNQVDVFNIYGVTELSCWSTLHRVERNDLDDPNGVPIVGSILSETKLWLRTQDERVLNVEEVSNSDEGIEGLLLHSSDTRKCLINDEVREYAESGDRALVKAGKVYVKGRDDRLVKINAKLTDLNALEQSVRSIPGVSDCSAWLHSENCLVLFIFKLTNTTTQINDDDLRQHVFNHVKLVFPNHYEPRRLIVVDDSNIPFNKHGKIDVNKLAQIYLTSSLDQSSFESTENLLSKADLTKLLADLWKKWINQEASEKENFVLSGGDSLKAVGLITDLEVELKRRGSPIRTDLFLDLLLNESFSALKHALTEPNHKQKIEKDDEISNKRFKPDILDRYAEIPESITCWFTKCSRFSRNPSRQITKADQIDVEFEWKIDTQKCVDASPLVVVMADSSSQLVFIGSHSHRFICADILTGRIRWTFVANDRIESSACVSKCGRFVIVGSYDKNVYVLEINTGEVYWHVETNDVVKSSPCLDISTGYVYFGSHDKHLYCIDIEKKRLAWKKTLDNSSIFAGPTICSDPKQLSVFATTLGGSLFSVDKLDGQINWRFVLDKSTFTSPILNETESLIFVGTCGGTFACVSFDGLLIWKLKVDAPIFSNACVAASDRLVIFGCHDQHVYCLDQTDGSLRWKSHLASEIYSSSFCCCDDGRSTILCVSCDGLLRLFNAPDGTFQLEKHLFDIDRKNVCYSSPIVYADRLLIGSRDNFLYSFKFKTKHIKS